jgi:hypothetical protein
MTPLEQKCVEIFKLISPKDLENISYKRYGCDNDGGYIMIENEVKGGLAYSFGIGGNVSWDIEMANHGYTVYQYDHTIENTPVQNKNFIFNKKGISNKIDSKLTTIEDIILKNKHQDETDIVLKCDIEGCEWDAFYQIKDNVLNCFSNILIEFHWFNALADDDVFYHKVHNVLEKLSQMFVPYHIHANNFGQARFKGLYRFNYKKHSGFQTNDVHSMIGLFINHHDTGHVFRGKKKFLGVIAR